MNWWKQKRAEGGAIPSRPGERAMMVGRGTAVVSDTALARYGRHYFERLNGPGTDVYSASEMAAAQEAADI